MKPRLRVEEEEVGRVAPAAAEPAPREEDGPAAMLLRMQQGHGNAAVARMLQGGGSKATIARFKSKAEKAAEKAEEADKAIAAGEWETAAAALALLPRDAIIEKLRALGPDDQDAIVAAAPKKSAELLRRCVSFIRNGLPDETPSTSFTSEEEGKLRHKGKVAGGKVEARTGGKQKVGTRELEEAYTLKYEGEEAEKTRWLQFIWREILLHRPSGKTERLDQEVSTTGGKYNLTTDPSKPNYNTDSADKDNPFYEAGGASTRTADSTTMLDMPSPLVAIVKAQFAEADEKKRPKKITSRAHFVSYLVRDMDVLYRVKVDVEWVFTDENVPPRKQSVSSAGTAKALDPRARERLLEQYPKFDFLP